MANSRTSLKLNFPACGAMRAPLPATRRGPMIWCRAVSPALSPSSIYGRKGRTCAPGCSRYCTTNTSMTFGARPAKEQAFRLTSWPRCCRSSQTRWISLQLRDLHRALGRLPEEQRQVILLVGLEGMRYEQVAQILNIPIGTVRSRLSRGRDMLRVLMGVREQIAENSAHRNKISPTQHGG